MSDPVLEYLELSDSGDARGSSFPVPAAWLAEAFVVRDAHISTVASGCTRGDHYHVDRHEVLAVMPSDRWSLHWDSGAGTDVRHQEFNGACAVIIRVPPLASHAIHNDGEEELRVIGLSDAPYDPERPDALSRRVSAL